MLKEVAVHLPDSKMVVLNDKSMYWSISMHVTFWTNLSDILQENVERVRMREPESVVSEEEPTGS